MLNRIDVGIYDNGLVHVFATNRRAVLATFRVPLGQNQQHIIDNLKKLDFAVVETRIVSRDVKKKTKKEIAAEQSTRIVDVNSLGEW